MRNQLTMHVPGARVEDAEGGYEPWQAALELGLSPTDVLLEEKLEDAARTVIAALQRAQGPRAVLVQWIVTPVRGRSSTKGDGAAFRAVGRIAASAQVVDEGGRRRADPAEARAILLDVRRALTLRSLDAEEVRQELLGVIAKAQAAVYEIGYLTLARRLTPDQGMEKLQELQDIAERMMGEIGLEPPTPPDPS